MTIFSASPFRSSPWQGSPFEDPFGGGAIVPQVLLTSTMFVEQDGSSIGWSGNGGDLNPRFFGADEIVVLQASSGDAGTLLVFDPGFNGVEINTAQGPTVEVTWGTFPTKQLFTWNPGTQEYDGAVVAGLYAYLLGVEFQNITIVIEG